MKFPNEHNFVLQSVGKEVKMCRVNSDFADGIDSIYSLNTDGSKNELISLRFRKNKYQVDDAKNWIESKNYIGDFYECSSNTDENEEMAFDSVEIIGKMKKTEEGYYKGKAVVTKIGVYKYINFDGTIRKEFKSPESAFEKDSLESLKMKPITNDHPNSREVNIDNAKQLQSGMTGETVEHDDSKLWVSLTITDKVAVDAIDSGKRQLSLGYKLKRIPQKGIYKGQDYNIIQKKIRYNHLAIVDKARCGDDICLNVDSWNIDHMDSVLYDDKNQGDEIIIPKRKVQNMEKITIKGINYDAAPEVINFVKELQSNVENSEGEIKNLKKDIDSFKAKSDTANDELKKIKGSLPEMIGERVKERVDMLQIANDFLSNDEKKGIDNMDTMEIKKKVIISRFPNVKDKINLDSTTDDYINARFDSTIEILKEESKNGIYTNIQKQRKKFFNKDSNNDNNDNNDGDKIFTYEDEMKIKKEMWRGKKD